MRLVFAALVGIAAGTISTASLAPFLWHFKSLSRERLAIRATQVAVLLGACFWIPDRADEDIKWSYEVFSHRAIIYTPPARCVLRILFGRGNFHPSGTEGIIEFRRHAKRQDVASEQRSRQSPAPRHWPQPSLPLAQSRSPVSGCAWHLSGQSKTMLITFDALSAETCRFGDTSCQLRISTISP